MMIPQLCKAVEMNDTILYSSQNNHTIYINSTINFDNMTVSPTAINISGLDNNGTFMNLNKSYNATLTFHNLLQALMYFDNMSVFCDNILSCDGTQSPSFSPLDILKVLNIFKVNESEERIDNPIWFAVNNSTAKHIVSNLTDTINVTSIWIGDNCSIYAAAYRANNSNYNYTLNSTNATRFMCEGNGLVTMNITGLFNSTNYITITYGTSIAETLWELAIIMGMVGNVGIFVFMRNKLDDSHFMIKQILYLMSFIMIVALSFMIYMIANSNDVNVGELTLSYFKGVMFVFLSATMFYVVYVISESYKKMEKDIRWKY